MKEYQDITDKEIKQNPYAYDEDQIIYTLETYLPSLRNLNRYQKLSAYICAKYVIFGGINEDNGDCVEDTYLDTYDILRHQKHLTKQDIQDAFDFLYKEQEKECNENRLMSDSDVNIQTNSTPSSFSFVALVKETRRENVENN